jgi:polyisoprenoid-binding protein YceI
MMRKILIVAATAFALAACGEPSTGPNAEAPVTPAASAAPAGTYSFDPHHTVVIARISHLGLSHYPVEFTRASGTLTIDPANPTAAQMEATIDITSLDTPFEGDYRATHAPTPFHSFEESLLKNADLFNVDQFPTATFRSTAVTLTGPNTADVVGDFTLRGVTKPLTLHVTFNGAMAAGAMMPSVPAGMGFSATGTFKRSDYGMTAMVGPLGDDIQIDIETDMMGPPPAPAATPAP